MKRIIPIIIILVALIMIFCSCSVVNNVKGIVYKNADKYSVGNFEYQAEEIDSIEINWVKGNITLVESDNTTLSVKESGNKLNENQKLRYLIEGKTLKIQFWKSRYNGRIDSREKDLTVEIPKNLNIDIDQVSGNVISKKLITKSLDINCVSGNTRIDSLSATSLNIDNVSGKVNIGNIICNNVDIDTVSGSLKIGNLNGENVDLNTVSGHVDIALSQATNVAVGSVSASVDIKLNNIGATVDFNTVSGKYHSSNGSKVFGDGACEIKVDTVSGSLTIMENNSNS